MSIAYFPLRLCAFARRSKNNLSQRRNAAKKTDDIQSKGCHLQFAARLPSTAEADRARREMRAAYSELGA